MGRPRGVNFKTFHLYDKLHTEKTKMYSGVEMTTLYPIKETDHYYVSPEVWAYCASRFKAKKYKTTLNVDIPILTDEKAIEVLERRAWKDWVVKKINEDKSDMKEAISLLDKVFPNKEKLYYFELDSLLGAYNQGSFISYDKEGNIEEPTQHCLENRVYYNSKCYMGGKDEKLTALYAKLKGEKDEKALGKIFDAIEQYKFEHYNVVPQLIEIGKHSVCYPVAFSDNTAEWSKEKYGKLLGYAHAGEIFFVATPDKVFFEIKRHF